MGEDEIKPLQIVKQLIATCTSPISFTLVFFELDIQPFTGWVTLLQLDTTVNENSPLCHI